MARSDSAAPITGSAALASEIHSAWDQAWPGIERAVANQGLEIVCREGCHGCCFDFKPCANCEGLVIAGYLRSEFSPEQQEHFRSRVEWAATTMRRLRTDGLDKDGTELARFGGVECPFLDRGRCAIYPVRPLACRSMVFAAPNRSQANTAICRECPASVICLEAQVKRAALEARMLESEPETGDRITIAETLSRLWESDCLRPATNTLTANSWEKRLASRDGWFDETWRDDGYDWQIKNFQLVMPEEGEHPPDLVVLRLTPDAHEVYGEWVSTNDPTELRVLYKLLPGGRFNWQTKVFESTQDADSHIVWMGDSLQERLMMWEAAKRCRGRVLCGGLGMGVFPQFALSLPRVDSVLVVDMDPAIISLIETTWANSAWPKRDCCSIRLSAIELFLKTTQEKFDTVYIDTWDALTYDYLPHVNYLKSLARRTLRPGGEVLLWGYDMMVRFALNQAKHILSRREYFLGADEQQLSILSRRQPLFHRMLRWYLGHPACSGDEFYTETYRLATTWEKDLGRLSLDRVGGHVG